MGTIPISHSLKINGFEQDCSTVHISVPRTPDPVNGDPRLQAGKTCFFQKKICTAILKYGVYPLRGRGCGTETGRVPSGINGEGGTGCRRPAHCPPVRREWPAAFREPLRRWRTGWRRADGPSASAPNRFPENHTLKYPCMDDKGLPRVSWCAGKACKDIITAISLKCIFLKQKSPVKETYGAFHDSMEGKFICCT